MSELDRTKVTFAQAEGAEPLPHQLKPKQVSQKLRAQLWAAIHGSLQTYVSPIETAMHEPWPTVLSDYHVEIEHGFIDDAENDEFAIFEYCKNIISKGDYIKIFGFIQFVIRHPKCPPGLRERITRALEVGGAAYRIVGDTVMPLASEAEIQTAEHAFAAVSTGGYAGAQAHLRTAAEELTAGHYADSIRESIHAVEAVARTLDPSATTLDPALKRLEREHNVHPALRAGFGKLYGFTSDAQGIRHALLDGPTAAVDEADALYMFGACAAFVSYLIAKATAAHGAPARPKT